MEVSLHLRSTDLNLDLSDIGDIYIQAEAPLASQPTTVFTGRKKLNMNDMIKNRQITVLAVIGAVNTTVTDGDAVVGAFLDIDQGYIELADGSGYRMSMGPVTKSEMRSVKKRLNLEE